MNWKLFADSKRRILVSVFFAAVIIVSYCGRLLVRHTRTAGMPFYEVEPFTMMIAVTTGVIAVAIASYWFAYLHSTRRTDFYHSLPVTAVVRFRTFYTGCLLVYAGGLVISVLISCMFGIPAGEMRIELAARILMSSALTIFFFLTVMNITIYAFTLSGNILIGLLIDAVLLFYIDLWERVLELTWDFATYSTFFAVRKPDISLTDIYIGAIYPTVRSDVSLGVSASAFAGAAVKLVIWFFLTYRMCRSGYLNRPAEASRSLIAFYSSHLLIKLMIVVPVALLMGNSTYNSFYAYRDAVQIISMIITAIVVSMFLETIFSRSLKTALRKWGSIIVSLIVIFVTYGITRTVEDRYNSYVPKYDELESYAVFNPLDSYYYGFNLKYDEDGHVYDYLDPAGYVKEHMILPDEKAILTLAAKSQQTDYHDMSSPMPLQVYYRLTNGRQRSRLIWVDMEDDENRMMLNRIVGPAYYKSGVWQAFDRDVPDDANVSSVDYHDLRADKYIHMGQGSGTADQVLAVWRDDMVLYDYDHIRYDEVAAEIEIHFDGGLYMWVLPVYEDMSLWTDR